MTAGYYLIDSGQDIPILDYSIVQQTARAIDTASVTIPKGYDSTLLFGNDVQLGYYSSGSFVIEFAGYVTGKKVDESLDINIESYGNIISRVIVQEVYYEQSPEAIVENMITNYTDLTYASTAVSGITISKLVVNNMTISEVLSNLGSILDWQVRTDFNKNFYYEPVGETTSAETLVVDSNCIKKGKWDEVPDRIINTVVFVGDNQRFNTSGTGVTSASGTSILLTYEPVGNIKVQMQRTGTVYDELVGGVEEMTGDYHYTWDAHNKMVIFSTPFASGSAYIIDYTYEIPVKINANDSGSVTDNGTWARKITNTAIKTMNDARNYVQTLFDKYAQPGKRNTLIAKAAINVNAGELIPVTDANDSISEDMIVQKVVKKYPELIKEITVGSQEFEQMDWNKDITERLKRLEETQDNSNLLQFYRSVSEGLKIDLASTQYAYYRNMNESPLWDTAKWDVDRWDGRQDGDSFNSYGAIFSIANVWALSSGSAHVSGSAKLALEANLTAQTADYKGWQSATAYYGTQDGRIKLDFTKTAAAGSFEQWFRMSSTANYYYVAFDLESNKINLNKSVSGATSNVDSVDYTFGTDTTAIIQFNAGVFWVYIDGGTVFIDATDSSISSSGSARLKAIGTTVYVNEVQFWKG